VYVAHVDATLVGDGTYFVHEVGGEIIACGGLEPPWPALHRFERP
jgi:hypothetical protein